ncbi:muts domain V-domain-containing protein [Rhodotorula diobovata]|uniref:Muts domain V-domain-containing protein n=1 Tax=Rhodotorula diobovata TaxID=5288 RepID=A0A5C5G4J6_9BASI|nr:muts domain V-domain-containing protein [Rhodotorula diobovata]
MFVRRGLAPAVVRSVSTSASTLASPRALPRTPTRTAKGRTSTSAGPSTSPPRVVLDEYGIERRSLPPLGLDGKPRDDEAPHEVDEPAKALKRTVRRRAPKTTPARGPDTGEGPLDDKKDASPPKVGVTALEKAIRADLAAYPDAILLTQVGSFFEVAKLLGIKLTSKSFGKGSHKAPQPFCGFPLFQLHKHVSALVEAGHKVVIVEEFKEVGRDSASAVTVRKVTRVVTPGTGVDEAFVDLEQSNFVLALGVATDGSSVRDEIGMAYRDISTGASFTRTSKLSALRDDIHLVRPKEVVVDERLRDTKLGGRILDLLRGESLREGIMVSETSTDAVPSSSTAVPSPHSAAEAVLLAYLANTLPMTPPPRTSATFVDPATVMQMDATTLKSLEIRESLRGGVRGSLLGAVRRTVTPGGHRLLVERLCAPSTDLRTILTRLALVSAFHSSTGAPTTRSYLRALLRTLDDTPRLLQRLALRRAHPAHDLLGLKRTMRALAVVRQELASALPLLGPDDAAQSAVRTLRDELGEFDQLADEIDEAIDEDALMRREEQAEREAVLAAELGERAASRARLEREATEEGGGGGAEGEGLWGEGQAWVIRPDFSPALAALHSELNSLREEASALQDALRTRYKSKNLSLKVAQRVGPAVHIFVRDGVREVEKDPAALVHQKTNSTRLYVVREWAQLHRRITDIEQRIKDLEVEATQVLVARVLENYDSLLHTADALAELDVVMGFAEVAEENGWVRPEVDTSSSLEIVAGRHPTVENALIAQNRSFTPNSVTFRHVDDVEKDPSFIHVLTGPNMAGKSTFLRQTALIAVLAQAGSYVPADSARLGICDRVFSRVGARDELDRDRSTFMIEMDEATSILENATSRSLVLLDELGRGTSPIDGLAIAYAALEHLAHVNRSRTLFATHYHRLGALLGYDGEDERARGTGEWKGVEFWCTDVEEREDSVRYVHTIRRGLNSDSAGLVIARLAGMPPRAILKAREMRDRVLRGEV